MAVDTINLSVRLAWWCKPYCYAMVILYHMIGRKPSTEQITKWVTRGMKIEVV